METLLPSCVPDRQTNRLWHGNRTKPPATKRAEMGRVSTSVHGTAARRTACSPRPQLHTVAPPDFSHHPEQCFHIRDTGAARERGGAVGQAQQGE
jgi:hypothetical protein